MIELTTERLLLRKIMESDDRDIYEYSALSDVGPNAGWKPHESVEETREIMNVVFLDKESVWGICLKDGGKLIGTIGLVEDAKRENDRAKMLGYAIGGPYWGRGYMTEAARAVVEYGFSALGLSLISAYCYPGNTRSRRVIEKCGFQYEGRLRLAEERFDGIILDNECFSLTQEEFMK